MNLAIAGRLDARDSADELFRAHMPLVAIVATRAKARRPFLAIEDLRAFALEGLWEAAQKYDLTRGTSFRAYAKQRMLGAIRDEGRATSVISRRGRGHGYVAVSTDDEDTDVRLVDERQSPEDLVIRLDEARRLRAAASSLDARGSALVSGHYFDERQFDHVALELGLSKSWASRIHTGGLKKLRARLAAPPCRPVRLVPSPLPSSRPPELPYTTSPQIATVRTLDQQIQEAAARFAARLKTILVEQTLSSIRGVA